METTLSVEDLERDVAAALARVRDGGRVVVERDGEPIAVLVPASPRPDLAWAGLASLLQSLPWPDPEFANDLKAIHAAQGVAEFPEWPD